jgi:hypothetical protein
MENIMNKQRLAILIASVIGALGTFMPWVKLPFLGTINGTKGDGYITFILFCIPVVISLLGERTSRISGVKLYSAFAGAGISSIIALYKIIDFRSKMGSASDNPFAQAVASSVSIEYGLYVIALAGIAVIASGIFVKDSNNA